MPAHPLIGVRSAGGEAVPYLVGSRIEVLDIVQAWEVQNRSVSDAAAFLGLSEEAIQAALAYWEDLGQDERERLRSRGTDADSGGEKGLAERIGQISAVFGVVAVVVYLTGGIVLALRLALDELPWQPVVSQLPREFLISIGLSQVLLPALVVAVIYATVRLLYLIRVPRLRPFRAFKPGSEARRENRQRFAKQVCAGALALFIPVYLFICFEVDDDGRWPLAWALGVLGGAVVCAGLAVEARGRAARRGALFWHSRDGGLLMTALYGAVTIPAFTAIFAVVNLRDAKVCTTSGFPEHGVLIGQSADGVYLGENRTKDPRIAVFPLSQVEEVFIGTAAGGAGCDPRSPQGVVAASLRRTEITRAVRRAERAAARAAHAERAQVAVAATARAGTSALDAAAATGAAGNVVSRTLPKRATRLWEAADETKARGLDAVRVAEEVRELPAAQQEDRWRDLAIVAGGAAHSARHAETVVRRGIRALLKSAKEAAE